MENENSGCGDVFIAFMIFVAGFVMGLIIGSGAGSYGGW